MADLPVSRMDLDEVLFLAIREEAPLWELPLGSECGMHGERVFHPPPDLADASSRLLGWLEAGLVELVEVTMPADWHTFSGAERRRLSATWHQSVPRTRAREVLADPARWLFEHPDGLLALCLTDEGLAADAAAWTED